MSIIWADQSQSSLGVCNLPSGKPGCIAGYPHPCSFFSGSSWKEGVANNIGVLGRTRERTHPRTHTHTQAFLNFFELRVNNNTTSPSPLTDSPENTAAASQNHHVAPVPNRPKLFQFYGLAGGSGGISYGCRQVAEACLISVCLFHKLRLPAIRANSWPLARAYLSHSLCGRAKTSSQHAAVFQEAGRGSGWPLALAWRHSVLTQNCHRAQIQGPVQSAGPPIRVPLGVKVALLLERYLPYSVYIYYTNVSSSSSCLQGTHLCIPWGK